MERESPGSAFTPRVRWMARVAARGARQRELQAKRASVRSVSGASDEGVALERPCPAACSIDATKGIRAQWAEARSLPFAEEKNRPGREQPLRRWPWMIGIALHGRAKSGRAVFLCTAVEHRRDLALPPAHEFTTGSGSYRSCAFLAHSSLLPSSKRPLNRGGAHHHLQGKGNP